jgi:hypothetical protein
MEERTERAMGKSNTKNGSNINGNKSWQKLTCHSKNDFQIMKCWQIHQK